MKYLSLNGKNHDKIQQQFGVSKSIEKSVAATGQTQLSAARLNPTKNFLLRVGNKLGSTISRQPTQSKETKLLDVKPSFDDKSLFTNSSDPKSSDPKVPSVINTNSNKPSSPKALAIIEGLDQLSKTIEGANEEEVSTLAPQTDEWSLNSALTFNESSIDPKVSERRASF